MEDTAREKQIARSERIQDLLLERWEKLLVEGTISPTEAGVVAKVLSQNGWSLDPSKLPTGIREKLLAGTDPTEFKEGDADILPIRRTK